MIGQILNWVPDVYDERDLHYVGELTTNPPSVDLRDKCSPVENQEQINSCTANALVGNLEFLEKTTGEKVQKLSRLFVYFNERELEGDVDQDHGSSLRDGIKALKTWGVCPEIMWPYGEAQLFVQPDQKAYASALDHRISRYERIKGLSDMKDCLASGYPFVFGFVVYESFMSQSVAATGDVPMPDPTEKVVGGHAVMAVGYDDDQKRLLCRNSWGTGWGQGGYFTLPYAYLTGKLAEDFWTVRS